VRGLDEFNVIMGPMYELEITLLEVEPPIWRRVAVPETLMLAELHDVIQAAMGWEDAHLHQFTATDGRRFGRKDPDLDPLDLFADAADTRAVELREVLRSPGDALRYDDFGDSWHHRVELLAVRDPGVDGLVPVCLDGARACPPEDCGGSWGYQELREALADPAHERHAELTGWIADYDERGFDPEAFDLDAANAVLRERFPAA